MEELLSKYFAGEATPSEVQEVRSWRQVSEENARLFFQAKAAWFLTAPEEGPDAQAVRRVLESNRPRTVFLLTGWLRVAASLAIIGLVGWVLWTYLPTATDAKSPFETATISLADGTQVTLAPGAKIKERFSDAERRVDLEGKAFFDVQKDATKPFIVVTDKATVRVLGTSFMVNPTGGFTEVYVSSGVVGFNGHGTTNEQELVRGERGFFDHREGTLTKLVIEDENHLAWKSGLLVFDKEPLAEVVESLERLYGRRIQVDEALLGCKLTAQYNRKSFEEVIQIIASTFRLNVTYQKDKVVLSGEGC
jgi:transmembrane sensor